MATKEERIEELEMFIKTCIKNDIGCEEEMAQLTKLKTGEEARTITSDDVAKVDTAKLMRQAQVNAQEVGFEDEISNPEKWAESAKYVLNKVGNFKSKLVRYIDPNTDKPQRWFVCETEDLQVPEPNRGILVGEFGRGAGIYHNILDDLGVKYKFDEATNKLSYRLRLPLYFYADWGSDDRAIGGVKISNITLTKPKQAQ